MDKVPYVDQSGLYAMEGVIIELQKKGVNILFVGIEGQTKAMFEKIGIIPNLINKNKIYKSISDI